MMFCVFKSKRTTRLPLRLRWSSLPLGFYDQIGYRSRRGLSLQHSILKAEKIENIYLALGSNVGDRVRNIEKACHALEAHGLKIVKTSNLYETQPMYLRHQDKFINAVCEITAPGYREAPARLLALVKEIEDNLGRVKSQDKGPRSIDIDILYIGDSRYEDEHLNIPHKGILEREFVLRPLADILSLSCQLPDADGNSLQVNLDRITLPQACEVVVPFPGCESTRLYRPLDPSRRTLLMGILNVTPDSFSDGDEYRNFDVDSMTQTCQNLDLILDIGGQSTRPDAGLVTEQEELDRVIPVMQQLQSHSRMNMTLSVDTFRSQVAKAAISHGAQVVNDVSGGRFDNEMFRVVAEGNVSFVLMHSRGTPSTMRSLNAYPKGLINEIIEEFEENVSAAQRAGVRRWRLILDPGLGFAKNYVQNLELMRSLPDLRAWHSLCGIPWLVGPSRKSFIGQATGVATARDRVHGTSACVAALIRDGADIVRVHDIPQMAQVINMSDSIWRHL